MKKLILPSIFILPVLIVIGLTILGSLMKNKVHGIGPCMEPTLPYDSWLTYDPTRVPKKGDIISFDCFSKCAVGSVGEYAGDVEVVPGSPEMAKDGSVWLTKRIIKIKKGCYWVEGDNRDDSWDSRAFGWLCPSDIKVQGVIISSSTNPW
jgi:hypothetical protein